MDRIKQKYGCKKKWKHKIIVRNDPDDIKCSCWNIRKEILLKNIYNKEFFFTFSETHTHTQTNNPSTPIGCLQYFSFQFLYFPRNLSKTFHSLPCHVNVTCSNPFFPTYSYPFFSPFSFCCALNCVRRNRDDKQGIKDISVTSICLYEGSDTQVSKKSLFIQIRKCFKW